MLELLLGGMAKNLPLLRREGNNGRPWVHAVMCDNAYSDICTQPDSHYIRYMAASVLRSTTLSTP